MQWTKWRRGRLETRSHSSTCMLRRSVWSFFGWPHYLPARSWNYTHGMRGNTALVGVLESEIVYLTSRAPRAASTKPEIAVSSRHAQHKPFTPIPIPTAAFPSRCPANETKPRKDQSALHVHLPANSSSHPLYIPCFPMPCTFATHPTTSVTICNCTLYVGQWTISSWLARVHLHHPAHRLLSISQNS